MPTPPDFTAGTALTAATLQKVGLWLISSGTSTGTTAYNYDGVFTSAYRNYRVILSGMESSIQDRAVRWNYRVGGVTNAANVYDYAFRGLRSNGGAADTSLAATTFAEIGVYLGSFANLKLGSVVIDVMAPVSVTRTFATSNAIGYESLTYQMRQGGFVHNSDTAFDGFRITLNGTGNITYDYAIYGYND